MFKIGDNVTLKEDKYYVPDEWKNKVFTIESEPWDVCGVKVIKLNGISGGYALDGIKKVSASNDW